KITERTEIVTNAYFLTPEMSEGLIVAGLDVLRISIQGLSADKYKKISKIDIDFRQLVENIRYFYNQRTGCRIYIKILDSSLDEVETKDRFHEIFGDLCDEIAVEHLVPVMSGVDYSQIQYEFKTGMQGYKNEVIQVCPRPFYMMLVNLDGTVRPCCNFSPPDVLGNIENQSIKEMWSGEKMQKFRLMQLYKKRNSNSVCSGCPTPVYGLHMEDDLDCYADRLLTYY
ncbi:MAG: SPASM domain-containing protein, partial [Thermincolia bacterium]